MKQIEFDNAHRRKHFHFFRTMEAPHFSIVTPIDVTELVAYIRDRQLHFSGTMVYLVSAVANELREFRWRIRGEHVIEHELVHPSFSVPTEQADVFSFCEVKFNRDFVSFSTALRKAQQDMRTAPSFEDEPDRDDYLFMSSIPWVHFTGFQHPMGIPAQDSVPRFAWGKIEVMEKRHRMPLNVQAHHAVVDGRHMGMYFERFAEYAADPESILGGE